MIQSHGYQACCFNDADIIYVTLRPIISLINTNISPFVLSHFLLTHFFLNCFIFIPGKRESKSDCLKSLMATYLFRQKISLYQTEGVNFKEHLYVPEVDEDISENVHDREDHNHILKRIGTCLRSGSIPDVDLHHFRDAIHNPNTGLTYEALTGKRKQ